jgi:uncharacterized membrane-anchored protein
MNLWPKLLVLLVLEVAALAVMVADKQWTLSTGVPVILKTEPVDPRSLFMGDYARLNYEISVLPLSGPASLGGDKNFRRHDPIWVALEARPEGARALSVHHRRADVPPGLIALKGEVESLDVGPTPQGQVLVRYGIEQYFIPEGTGGAIERPQGGEKVSLRVAIDDRGKAGILAVLFDGRERYRETLF